MRSTYKKAQQAQRRSARGQPAREQPAGGGKCRGGCRRAAPVSPGNTAKFAPRKARRAPSDAPSNALSHEPLIARNGLDLGPRLKKRRLRLLPAGLPGRFYGGARPTRAAVLARQAYSSGTPPLHAALLGSWITAGA
jgi:hypothetical protein